jgi:hypothetical protein
LTRTQSDPRLVRANRVASPPGCPRLLAPRPRSGVFHAHRCFANRSPLARRGILGFQVSLTSLKAAWIRTIPSSQVTCPAH